MINWKRMSSSGEVISEDVGLENADNGLGDGDKCESSKVEEVIDIANKDHTNVQSVEEKEIVIESVVGEYNPNNMEVPLDNTDDVQSNDEVKICDYDDSGEICDDSNEDERLLSEISELVDDRHGVENSFKSGEVGIKHNSFKNVNERLGADENMEVMEAKLEEEIDEVNNYTQGEVKDVSEPNMVTNNSLDNSSVGEVKKPKERAVNRLASLGLISEEEPIVEDKETILKKLASRGGISIMPTGSTPSSPVSVKPPLVKPTSLSFKSSVKSPVVKSASSSNPISSTLTSGTVTPTSPTCKLGSTTAKKKIKIDPGKSLDIDKDFNNLINFLSTGADVSSTSVTSSTLEEKNVCDETVSDKVNEPITQLDVIEGAENQNKNDDQVSGMEIDTNDDKTVLQSESEIHDGSKFDNSSEIDEKTPVINKNKNVIEEGSAEILLSANKNVFYNKVQEFNRDMSIAALTVFSEMHQQDPRTRNRGKKRKAGGDSNDANLNHSDAAEEKPIIAGKRTENGITILEALSATGLRSIRYAQEISGVKEVIANDLSEDAVETIKKNVKHNRVEDMVTTSMSDASLLMYQRQASQQWYDVVDLDPYGCPARFLDAAVQAVRDGGLLLVTCTDMAILAGNAPETCYVKYGAVSLRMPACHEMALRIALQCIESHANRYGRYIVPLLSFSADFYIRLIVQVYTSPVTCKRTTSKLAMVYQCVGCGTHSLHPLGNVSESGHNAQPKFSLAHGPPVGSTCFHCQHKHYIGGPIWAGPLYSTKFVENMLRVAENGKFATAKRMQGMLEVIREELQDVPLYYTIAGLCTKLHCQAIPLIDIRSAILNAGYRVSSSHATPTAVKTNAPSKVIWDIMRCWVHMNPVSKKRLIVGSVSASIILEPPNLIANFDIHPRARPSSATRKLVRYQQNPEKNWGPGTRARCNNAEDTKDEKRRLNQNKNKNKKHIDIIEVVTIDDEDEMTEEVKQEEPTEPETEVMPLGDAE